MKTVALKLIVTGILFVSFAMHAFSQAAMTTTDKGGKKPEKIEKAKVPAEVSGAYIRGYPVMGSYENWYGYPAFSDESDWYGYNPYYYTGQYPEYYFVEFDKENVPHKVIYTKAGKKVATHRRITSEVPKAVSDALRMGAYKSWGVAAEKEEIFKDADKDIMKVYKITVDKGKDKHVLFYLTDGKLLKDTYIKPEIKKAKNKL